ncbi:DUF3029 family protein, partial [Salmonella enterica subsp. enterica serovar Kentucky]|nr:DUF3029 family protein [Salmonella enterica subsp. enterica serovar Kentucky]
GYRISAQLADFVENTPVKYGWKQRALLHAQSGISSDIGTTPGPPASLARLLTLLWRASSSVVRGLARQIPDDAPRRLAVLAEAR